MALVSEPAMKILSLSLLLSVLSVSVAHAEITAGRYDMASVRDPSTLETKVIEEWHPSAKDPSIRQKLVEIIKSDVALFLGQLDKLAYIHI